MPWPSLRDDPPWILFTFLQALSGPRPVTCFSLPAVGRRTRTVGPGRDRSPRTSDPAGPVARAGFGRPTAPHPEPPPSVARRSGGTASGTAPRSGNPPTAAGTTAYR